MLAQKLANLADAMLTDATLDRPLSPARAAKVSTILLTLSREAAAMEDRPVPLRARLPRPRRQPQQPLRAV